MPDATVTARQARRACPGAGRIGRHTIRCAHCGRRFSGTTRPAFGRPIPLHFVAPSVARGAPIA